NSAPALTVWRMASPMPPTPSSAPNRRTVTAAAWTLRSSDDTSDLAVRAPRWKLRTSIPRIAWIWPTTVATSASGPAAVFHLVQLRLRTALRIALLLFRRFDAEERLPLCDLVAAADAALQVGNGHV